MTLNVSPVSFKSDTNLIADAMRRSAQNSPKLPSSEPISEEQMQKNLDELHKALSAKSIEDIIKNDAWEKTYNPATNSVHAKIRNSYDGKEFDIFSNGKVVSGSGWSNPEVEKEKDEKLAQYVDAMKQDYEKSISGDKFEKENFKELSEVEKLQKTEDFKTALNSRKWEKEYLPENNIIMLREKRVFDGTEYMIKNDGTVMETGANIKPRVIVEPGRESAEIFGKLKHKLDPNVPKKSLWMKGKEAVADIWKFFTVTGTMAAATAKGIAQGVVVGGGVLAATAILRGAVGIAKNTKTISDVIKHPVKTAGVAGNILALAAATVATAIPIIAGRMNANQKSAVIEHKIDVQHVNN